MTGTQPPAAEEAPRCPSCRSLVRPDAPWCTQCFFDLRPPPPEPEPAPGPPARLPQQPAVSYPDPLTDPLPPARDPLTDALAGQPGPPRTPPSAAGPVPTPAPMWPCGTCGQPNPLESSICSACGSGFLAGLKEDESPLLLLPGVGDLTRYSRAQRIAFAGAVVALLLIVIVVLGLLVP